MKEGIMQIVREMQTGTLQGPELEEKEFLVLQEFCGNEAKDDLIAICYALGASGTILAIPALCAHLESADPETLPFVKTAIQMIRARAKGRGSMLPDEFYTPAHFRPKWYGSKNAFLSYVQAIADIYIKTDHEESEVDRIGGILAAEMDIDLSPYQTFADFRICRTTGTLEGITAWWLPGAIVDLRLLGVTIPVGYEEAVKRSVSDLAEQKRKKNEAKLKRHLEGIEQDEYFAFIAGYTGGGAPYGLTWAELDEEEREMYTYKELSKSAHHEF